MASRWRNITHLTLTFIGLVNQADSTLIRFCLVSFFLSLSLFRSCLFCRTSSWTKDSAPLSNQTAVWSSSPLTPFKAKLSENLFLLFIPQNELRFYRYSYRRGHHRIPKHSDESASENSLMNLILFQLLSFASFC